MIIVQVSELQFEYDIHSLVKAFFPEEDVSIRKKEDSEASESGEEHLPVMEIMFQPGEIQIKWKGDSTVTAIEDYSNRGEVKNQLKQGIYYLLSASETRNLPWGTLTGIRPTKIPMHLLEQGKTDDEISEYMKSTYQVSSEKISLGLQIAKQEKKILEAADYKNGYSLYVGIPFCPTTCLYCSFTSFPISAWENKVGNYLDALERELDLVAKVYHNRILHTIYIGGGTPTTLKASELERMLRAIESRFNLENLMEYTVEAGRPDSISEDRLEVLKNHSVTRISINPQTMKDATLKTIGRNHTVAQAVDAFELARRMGFDNINMDLIMGLPGETVSDVKDTMSYIKQLDPDSITVHSLAVKRASRLNQWMEEHGRDSIQNTPEMMEVTELAAKEMDMEPYYLYRQKNMAGNFENVGYAKKGKYGTYNILIMEEIQSIAAVGAGTITKAVMEDGRIERVDNIKDVRLYLERFEDVMDKKEKFYESYC